MLDPSILRAFSDDARFMVRKILEQIGVDRFQVLDIESAGDRGFEKLFDSAGYKNAFAFLAKPLRGSFRCLTRHGVS